MKTITQERIIKTLNKIGAACKAKHKSICDRTISYHSSVGQLNLLERDLAVLSKEKDKVVNFFLEVIDLGVKYELFLEDENEEWHPYDVSKLRAIANNAISAYIRSESYKWRNTGTGWSGTSTERLYPDKIILSLGMSELGSIEERSQMFVAVHPDKSRQPWLAEEE